MARTVVAIRVRLRGDRVALSDSAGRSLRCVLARIPVGVRSRAMTAKHWLLVIGAVVFVLALLLAPQLPDDPPPAARPDL